MNYKMNKIKTCHQTCTPLVQNMHGLDLNIQDVNLEFKTESWINSPFLGNPGQFSVHLPYSSITPWDKAIG